MSATRDVDWMAEQLGLRPDTIRRMVRRGDLPHVKVGRRVRFTDDNLAEYLAAHTRHAGMRRTVKSQQAHRRTA